MLRRQFQPLLDPEFDRILARHYPRGVVLSVNGVPLTREAPPAARAAPIAVRLARKRSPSAVGWIAREPAPLPEDQRGLAISTLGKVIKRGWDWPGLAPQAPDRIAGLIEAPALAECLTLNKADSIRTGARGALYTYRKVIQEAVGAQLAAWGDLGDAAGHMPRRAARPLERDIESVLARMADRYPLLAALVEHRAGGQIRLAVDAGDGHGAAPASLVADGLHGIAPWPSKSPLPTRRPGAPHRRGRRPGPASPAGRRPSCRRRPRGIGGPGGVGAGRSARQAPTRYGLSLRFAERADDPELARLVETTVWINEAHPAYRRAVASRSEGYHIAVAVALALASVATDRAGTHEFVTAFLSAWGAATARRARGRAGGSTGAGASRRS